MEQPPEQNEYSSFKVHSVQQMLEQAELILKQPGLTKEGLLAMENLTAALKAVMPFLPQLPQIQPDELSLENDIRKEIRIAGANENG